VPSAVSTSPKLSASGWMESVKLLS
jgi:hypothetical protein